MKSKTYYNIHEAKTHLSAIAEAVASGLEVVVGKAGVPMMILMPFDQNHQSERKIGFARGRGKIKKEFFDLLSDQDLGDMI